MPPHVGACMPARIGPVVVPAVKLELYARLASDWRQSIAEHKRSVFDLEHHITYLAEIRVGDTVSVYNRVLSNNGKLFQGMFFVVNDTREQLVATIEYRSICIDLEQRRAAAFPAAILGKLNELQARHQALAWSPAVCGLMDL